MDFIKNIISSKNRLITVVAILSIAIVYILLSIFLFESDPLIRSLSVIEDSYLLLYESFANLILWVFHSNVFIDYHYVVDIKTDMEISGFTPELRLKKWSLIILLLVWITKAPAKKKLIFTIILLLIHFITISVYIAIGAKMAGSENQNVAILTIPLTIAILALFTYFFTWYRKYKDTLLATLSKIKIDPIYFKNDLKVLAIVYIYIILVYFIIEFFDFRIWVKFILTTASHILSFIGYEAIVEPFRIVGEYGNIYLVKGCLGFQTMFVFAILVFLTSQDNFYRWTYITVGLIFLNIVNILRFVVLFIHVENNRGLYVLGIELHDIYNYVVYLIIFLLWVIWFEKFSKKKFGQKKLSGKETNYSEV